MASAPAIAAGRWSCSPRLPSEPSVYRLVRSTSKPTRRYRQRSQGPVQQIRCAQGVNPPGGCPPRPRQYEKPSLIGGELVHPTGERNLVTDGHSGGETAPIGSSPRAACGEFYELSLPWNSSPVDKSSTELRVQPQSASPTAKASKSCSPRAGAYRALSSGGMQVDSTLPSRPMYGFSRANRFRRSALDPKPELNSGKLPPTAVGKQVLSDLRTAPQCGFGKSSRFRPASAVSTPGPGSYNT